MSRAPGFVVPPLAACAWCGRLCRGRDEHGEPRCAEGHGGAVPIVRVVRPAPAPRAPWTPDVGELTREELLTCAVTVDGSWWAP